MPASFILPAYPVDVAKNSSIVRLPSASAIFCSSVRLVSLSWFCTILPKSVTDTPSESAKALRCMTFILLNSASPPTFFSTSCVAPTRSPLSDNSLALSKLISRPSSTEASICLFILDSKSSKPSPILTKELNSIPNFLAATAAVATFFPPSFA